MMYTSRTENGFHKGFNLNKTSFQQQLWVYSPGSWTHPHYDGPRGDTWSWNNYKLMEKLTHCQEAEGLRSLTGLLRMRAGMLMAASSYFLWGWWRERTASRFTSVFLTHISNSEIESHLWYGVKKKVTSQTREVYRRFGKGMHSCGVLLKIFFPHDAFGLLGIILFSFL